MLGVVLFFAFFCFSLGDDTGAASADTSAEDSYTDYFDTLNQDYCSAVPRVRRNYANLSPTERQQFVALLKQMKATKLPLREGNYNTLYSLYDHFAMIHNSGNNANCWHGTTHFFVAHRFFVWNFESALRYVCRVYGSSLNPALSRNDCCNLALPYWPWETEMASLNGKNYNMTLQNNSVLFSDPTLMGPCPNTTSSPDSNTYITSVSGGQFTSDKWVTSTNVSADPINFQNTKAVGWSASIKRQFSCSSPFVYGPSQIMTAMAKSPASFQTFACWFENGCHSFPHVWLGFHMKTMSSPDEPLFWLHHSSIERFHTMWQDCWDGELVPNSQAVSPDHYEPANPTTCINTPTPPPAKPDYSTPSPYAACNVSMDCPINFYFVSSSGSKVMPKASWPSPRKVHFIGHSDTTQVGEYGMNFRYSDDPTVQAWPNVCSQNTKWRLVNQPWNPVAAPAPDSKKRSTNELLGAPKIQKDWNSQTTQDQIDVWKIQVKSLLKITSNMSALLEAVAMLECNSAPSPDLDANWLGWLQMNGYPLESTDRICHNASSKPSARWRWKKALLDAEMAADALAKQLPNWVIPVSVVLGVLLIVGIASITYFMIKRKKETKESDYELMPPKLN